MSRRTIFGPDMGNSDWTPIDDDWGYQLSVKPVGMQNLTSPWNENDSDSSKNAGDRVEILLSEFNSDSREKNTWLDYIAGLESARDGYNAVLGDGRYGKPEKNISDMTLDEVKGYQRKELLPSARREGKNSSAVGRYQIVNDTLGRLVKRMGLKGDEKFSPEMQDRMAWHLTHGRGRDVAGLRKEWEAFQRRPSEEILRAYDQGLEQHVAPVRNARQAAEQRARDAMNLRKNTPIRSDARPGFSMFRG